jgi:hypothetical protein
MEPHKADLVADAAYPANANANVYTDAGADANANSVAATAPDATYFAAALIALATSLPTVIPNISSIMNPYPPRGMPKHINGSEILCSQSVWFQLNDAFEDDCDFDVDVDSSAMENGKSNGIIIPGAEQTPDDIITIAAWRKAAGHSIAPSNIIDINQVHKRWIRQAMLNDWGIHSPHEFQLCTIHHIAFQCNQLLYIITKTGSGKSAIPLTIGLLQTGVTLLMVPLVGLGSDQVNKKSNNDNLIEAYHLNKHRGVDGKALRVHLLSLNKQEANHVSIFLYASPQSLQVGTFWYQCLLTLLSCNMVLIVIDEAHTVTQDGRSFRLELQSAMESLKCIMTISQISATELRCLQLSGNPTRTS